MTHATNNTSTLRDTLNGEFNPSTGPSTPTPASLLNQGGVGEWGLAASTANYMNTTLGGVRRLLSMADIVAEYGIKKPSLSRAINGKLANCTKLPCVSIGRRRMVIPESLDAWLRENER